MMWYLQLTDSLGHWYTTKGVINVFMLGMKKPLYMKRWDYFKSFAKVFCKGIKKHKPIIFGKIEKLK